ncbi:MAG: hypothetical protein C4539_08970 [Ignavibacteriales bacterium]|nr:MAG: hypothetical protein C4539_08970 [Ignavibacteriales bacterium]
MENDSHIVIKQTDKPHLFAVSLIQNNEERLLGILDESGEGTFITLRNDKQIFKATNSFGISYDLLTRFDIVFRNILFVLNGEQKFISSREYFLKKGKPFQFKGHGLQLFVSLDELNNRTLQQFEREAA